MKSLKDVSRSRVSSARDTDRSAHSTTARHTSLDVSCFQLKKYKYTLCRVHVYIHIGVYRERFSSLSHKGAITRDGERAHSYAKAAEKNCILYMRNTNRRRCKCAWNHFCTAEKFRDPDWPFSPFQSLKRRKFNSPRCYVHRVSSE